MTREIPVGAGIVTLVDDEDFGLHADVGYAWRLNRGGYVCTTMPVDGKRRMVLLHRLILGAGRSQVVDHKSGDILDNRRCNLRICSTRQNTQNRKVHSNSTTGFKGVYKKDGEAYRAAIMRDGKQIALGYFDEAIAAALAYDRASVELFGEFARPNFDLKRDWIFPQNLQPRPRTGQGLRNPSAT